MHTAFGSAAGVDMVRRYPVEVDWTLQRHPVWRTIIIAVLGFLSLAAWAVSSPAGSSPDDDFHLTSIWCAQGERVGLCENITEKSVDVPNNVVHAPCFAFNKDVTAACQDNLGTELVSMGRANELEHSYPGGFYWVMSWFAGPDVTLSVILMRLFNAALFVGMTAATLLLIKRKWRGPLALGIAVTIVPLGMFIVPSTNPSSWTLYAPAFVFLLLRTLARNTGVSARSVGLAVSAAAIAAIASSARGDAAMFVVIAAGLALLAEWRTRWWRNPLMHASGVLIGAVALVTAVTSRQSGAASTGLSDPSTSSQASLGLLLRNIVDVPGLYAGVLGNWNLGWLDTPIPSMVWVGLTMALGALAVSAISYKERYRELRIPAFAAGFMLVIPLAVAQSSGAAIGSYVQPRYVLPLLALTLVALMTTSSTRIMISRVQANITITVVIVANAIALTTNTLRYTTGLSNITAGTGGIAATDMLTVGLGTLAFAAVACFPRLLKSLPEADGKDALLHE